MLVVLVPILLGSLVLLVLGLRGYMVAGEPRCRRCGFDLRGRPADSPRCPECGTELNEQTIRIRFRRRRPAMIATGATLALLSGGVLGVAAVAAARDYDWRPWEPTSWLLSDVESGPGTASGPAIEELNRRLSAPGTNQSTVDQIVDRALAHQADRSARWDSTWGSFIDAAGTAKHLSADRAARYLQQAVSATLSAKPRLRRGQYFSVELHYGADRMGWNTQLQGSWETSPLMLGSAIVQKSFISERQDHAMGSGGTSGYVTSLQLEPRSVAPVPDGKQPLTTTFVQTYRLTAPFQAGPVTVRIPLSVPVELFPKDAIVDDFRADPAQRAGERAAVLVARVLHDQSGHVAVRIKTTPPPVPLAMQAIIVQNGQEEKIGTLLIGSGGQPRWTQTTAWRKPRFSGTVDLHLRPDQAAADNQGTLGTYWGEEIIIPGVVVDAPYDPPFKTDPTLRPWVETAIQRPTISRMAGSVLSFNAQVNSAPVKLAYTIYLSSHGQEREVGNWLVPASQNYGWGAAVKDFDAPAQASSCDVIFRPNRDWEPDSQDLALPWSGEVIFHDVKINAPSLSASDP